MKKVTFGLITVLVIGVAITLVVSGSSPEDVDTGGTSTPTDQIQRQELAQTFTLEEIAQHNTAQDCWMAIDGTVYDLSTFIDQHPGGDDILRGCGIDATELFYNRDGRGTSHSPVATALLGSYVIGILAE